MAETDLERVMAKIQKCLALAHNNENPNEAANALRQAQVLMAKYNLTTTDLDGAQIGEGFIRSRTSCTRVKPYEGRLVQLIGRAFGCKVLWLPGDVLATNVDMFGHFLLVGTKAQVAVATHTAIVLTKRLEKARKDYLDKDPNFRQPMKVKTIIGNGFCEGWVDGIERTVVEYAQPQNIVDAIEAHSTKLTTDREGKKREADHAKQKYDALAAEDGFEAAAREALHRPVGKTEAGRLSFAGDNS